MFFNILYSRKVVYFILLVTSSILCWNNNLEFFFTTFISSVLLAKILFCSNSRVVRTICIPVLILFSIASTISYLNYGDLTTSMVMASVGVSIYTVIGTIKALGGYIIFLTLLAYIITTIIVLHTPRAKYSKKNKVVITILLIISLIIPLANGARDWGWRFYLNNIKYSPSFISQSYLDNYKIFFGYIISVASIYVENYQNEYLYKKVNHKMLPSYLSKNHDKKQKNIIYVIGESSNPGRYSIYQYNYNTTPHLYNYMENNEFCVIKKVHSPAAQTRLAVPMLMSLQTPDDRDALFYEPNLVEIAKMQGYKTYWLDTQTQFNLWDKTFGFISQYADILVSPDRHNVKKTIKSDNDEALLALVKYYISSPNISGNNFFVIHLIGQHLPYNSFITNSSLKDKYDKSVYSTDYMLNEIKILADKHLKDYILIYLSDHGEVVGRGHGYTTSYNEMYKIPLLMTQSKYCNEIEKFRYNKGYINSNMIKYIILNMMGISVSKDKIQNEIKRSNIILNSQEQKVNFNKLIDAPMPYEKK
ncbi:phosphoethanolamine transferase [Salmonella enterica]|nr:phosphoethanolamine transferase [Salmonella enterica]EDV4827926.1 phosphoethanolamine transferase [Salmonella enterica]EHJ5404093.1 phosphoethanolamine transferase [Salmonella enterica subsp. enterica serovar Wedding]